VEGDDWDVIWSEKEFIPELYERRLAPHQRVNHFRNYHELCRKDQLIRNLKKHKKALEKEGKTAEAAQ
jgi:tubulin polyglutamylase TTLL9